MKKLGLLLLLVLVLIPFASAQTIGSANITATGSFTLNAGQTLTLHAQIVGCNGDLPTYQGNPISITPNQTPSAPFTADGSEVVTFTLPGNDQIVCGGQNYSLYAITWEVNGHPAGPTKTYRFVDGTTINLNTATSTGFVPPIINNTIGAQCEAGYVLNGYNADFTPICQALSNASTVVSTSTPNTQTLQSNLVAPTFVGALNGHAAQDLALAGGNLTGPLYLSGSPTASNQAATKDYVDTKLPISGGELTGPLNGTVATFSTVNGTQNTAQEAGATVAERVNSAISACATTGCKIEIPPNEVAGSGWTTPIPSYAFLSDLRYLNNPGFAFVTPQPYLHGAELKILSLGANLPNDANVNSGEFVQDLEAQAYAGGTAGDGRYANVGALLIFVTRTAGNRPIWGQDINVQFANLTNTVFGTEYDIVNNAGTDDIGDKANGIALIASGANKPGLALMIDGSSQSWEDGAIIQNYARGGLSLTGDAGRSFDLQFIPPADDNNFEIVGRNHANTANAWVVDDSGNFSTNGAISALLANVTTYRNGNGILIPGSVIGNTGPGPYLPLVPGIEAFGSTTLVSGAATVNTTASCSASASCVYKLTNCGKNASTAIGVLSVASVVVGTSFTINALTATGTVATGDLSTVCWQIN